MYVNASRNLQGRGRRRVLSLSHPDAASFNEDAVAEAAWEKARSKAIAARQAYEDMLREAPGYIKRRREARGLTKASLAHKLGVTRVMITRLENGTSKPSREAARKLSQIFHAKMGKFGFVGG